MKIQLYSNCILTERYTEVFRTQALLESYLATLDSPLIQEIDIEDTYTKIVGTLCLDITQFSSDGETVESEIKYKTFNYIKFTDLASNNNRVSYAFVSSFSFANGLLVINYVQDIWHTYLGTWSLRKSLLTNCRNVGDYPNEIHDYELPLDYITNYPLSLVSTVEETNFNKCKIIARIQFYKLASGGANSEIVEGTYVLTNYFDNYNADYYTKKVNGVGEAETAESLIGNLITCQGFEEAHIPDLLGSSFLVKRWYKINKIWVIPNYFLPSEYIDHNMYGYISDGRLLDPSEPYKRFKIYHLNVAEYDIPLLTLSANPYIKSIGFYTKQMPYNYNGKTKQYDLHVETSRYLGIKFYLKSEDGYNEISDIFEEDLYFDITTGDVLMQQEIQRKMATVNGFSRIITGGIKAVSSATALVASGGASEAKSVAVETLKKFNQQKVAKGLERSYGTDIGGIGGITGGIADVVNGIYTVKFANAEKYKNCIFVDNTNFGRLNAFYGLCYFVINENHILNDYEVTQAINEVGFLVNTFVSEIKTSTIADDGYNVLKFQSVKIIGLSTEICEIIANILINGIKIWYTINV